MDDTHKRCSSHLKPRVRQGVFIADMDPNTLAVRGLGAFHSLSDADVTEGNASISPDSRFLAFKRGTAGNPEKASLIVRSLENKTELEIKTCGQMVFNGRSFWLPDGNSLFVIAPVTNGGGCLGSYNAQTGQLLNQPVNVSTYLLSFSSALSPDGKLLYTVSGTTLLGTNVTLFAAVDPLTGQLSEPFHLPITDLQPAPPQTPIFGVSPDGRSAAHIRGAATPNATLVRYETNGADRHFRPLFVAGTRMRGVAWSKDGSRILFAVSEDGFKWRIIQIPSEGGNPTFTGLEVTGLGSFELNRDNTQIVFDGTWFEMSVPGPYTPPPAPLETAQPTTNSPANGSDGPVTLGQ